MYKAVIFDWGGVMAAEGHGGWVVQFAELLGLPVQEAEPIWNECYTGFNTGEISEDTFWSRVEKQVGYKLPDSKRGIWEKGVVMDPWPEMIAFADELRAEGIKTAVLSNIIPNMVELTKREHTYIGFSPVILSAEVGLAKPNIKIYELMLEELKLLAKNCVFIDDREENVSSAQALGIKGIVAAPTPRETIQRVNQVLGR
jgi:putative hydrolase of the HAD superfamily